MEGSHKPKVGGTRKLKEWIMDYFRQGHLPLGESRAFHEADDLVLTREFQTHRFKIPLLERAEIAIRLDIGSWWGLA